MTAQSRMGQYDDVNQEIQRFLAAKGAAAPTATVHNTNTATREQAKQLPDILPLLQSLLTTYSEIKMNLESSDADALKDTLLKSDVKMSLVCETLLETLKMTTEEKNRLTAENKEQLMELRKLQEEEAVGRVQRERLENDLELRNREVEELTRISKDLKQRVESARQEVQRAKSEVALTKVRVEELENLKAKASERIGVHEKEVAALSRVIKEKDAEVRRCMAEKREEEGKNSGAKMRVVELEREIEVLNRKLETKERSLTLCNNELSKLLSESRTVKNEFEKHRESCGYYEKLYRNLDNQNLYLTNKLNKLIREKEAREGGSEDDLSRKAIKKYKKKSKKRKERAQELEREIEKLKEELEDVRNEAELRDTTGMATEQSDTLIKRIDELTEKNREYRSKIGRIEDEKRAVERKLEELERRRDALVAVEQAEMPRREYQYGRELDAPVRGLENAETRQKPFLESLSVPERPQRMFNLECIYDEKPETVPGGCLDDSGLPPVLSTLFVPEKKQAAATGKREGKRDGESNETVKTYHTTSTLRDMMARTDNLQRKFEALEEQLANIKDEDTAERLSERVKAYSNNFSNWNVNSDDSDFI